jgi:hypothetical protein
MAITQYPKNNSCTARNRRATDPNGTFNPPILATQFLERLGYRLTDIGLENKSEGLKILSVEHEHDGTPADFAFASNMQCTAGVILPHPIAWYIDWIGECGGWVDEEAES